MEYWIAKRDMVPVVFIFQIKNQNLCNPSCKVKAQTRTKASLWLLVFSSKMNCSKPLQRFHIHIIIGWRDQKLCSSQKVTNLCLISWVNNIVSFQTEIFPRKSSQRVACVPCTHTLVCLWGWLIILCTQHLVMALWIHLSWKVVGVRSLCAFVTSCGTKYLRPPTNKWATQVLLF